MLAMSVSARFDSSACGIADHKLSVTALALRRTIRLQILAQFRQNCFRIPGHSAGESVFDRLDEFWIAQVR